MARILLGVSGGIAAYKALEVVRLATNHTRCPRYIGDICRDEAYRARRVRPGPLRHAPARHRDDLRELQKTPPPGSVERAAPSSTGGENGPPARPAPGDGAPQPTPGTAVSPPLQQPPEVEP